MNEERKLKLETAVKQEIKMHLFDVIEWAGDLVCTSREGINTLSDEESEYFRIYTAELCDRIEKEIDKKIE